MGSPRSALVGISPSHGMVAMRGVPYFFERLLPASPPMLFRSFSTRPRMGSL